MKIKFNTSVCEFKSFDYTMKHDQVMTTFTNGTQSEKDTFDFRSLPDGKLEMDLVETSLGENPLVQAYRQNGELYVTLRRYCSPYSGEEELYPDRIGYTDYKDIPALLKKWEDEAQANQIKAQEEAETIRQERLNEQLRDISLWSADEALDYLERVGEIKKAREEMAKTQTEETHAFVIHPPAVENGDD